MSRIVHWRIGVQGSDGSFKPTLDRDSAVTALGSFAVTPAGDCGEASFTVIPSQVNLKARDIIMFQTSPDAFTTVRSVYKGVVVLVGDERGDEPVEVRCVGLAQRLYEVPYTPPYISGGDVATMVFNVAQDLLSTSSMPLGITHYDGRGATGFELGTRYPNYESVGAFLDAMAVAAGPFVVPPGETYSYGSRTWLAGQIVPGCEWGVNASGGLFFYRPDTPLLTLFESDRRVNVRWGSVAAEDVVNAPTLMYLNGISDLAISHRRWWSPSRSLVQAEHPVPVVRQLGTGMSLPAAQRASRVVEVPNPLDFMAEASLSIDFVGFWTDLGNAIDGNSGTYATAATSIPTMATGTFLAGAPASPGAGGAIEGILMVDYMPVADGQFNRVSANDLTVTFAWQNSSGQNLYQSTLQLSDAAANQRAVMYLPVVIPADLLQPGDPAVHQLLVSVTAAANLRLYEVKLYTPDCDHGVFASHALANSLEVLPEPVVAGVTYQGLGDVSDRATLIKADGSVVGNVPIQRVVFSVTVDGGASTSYEVGQAFEGDLLVERAVLEKLSQSATGRTKWRI